MGNYCSCFGLRKGRKCSDGKNRNESSKNIEKKMESPASEDDSTGQNKAQIFTFRELATATKNFKTETLIGQGGFGSVYKGQLEKTGQVVAVKRLEDTGVQGEKEFLVEILMLSLLHHSNLVNMIGYCAEGNQRLLVYEYMPLGSLEDHLHNLPPDKQPLDWNTRIMIAAGAAKGLDYLHCLADPPVIYRDLKSSNILLDEDFQPKLSDFGLAKFGPGGDKSHVSTRVMGTHGYCAPEYALSGKLTMKSDIYTFGVVLLELITGCKPLDESRGHAKQFLVDWARPMMKDDKNILQLADPQLEGQFSESIFKKTVEVATMCLQENVHTRPSSSQLVDALNYLMIKQSEQIKASKSSEKGGSAPKKGHSPDGKTEDHEALRTLNKEIDRLKAVEEARMWGESWREKKQPDGINR